jgi:hypothetical protein
MVLREAMLITVPLRLHVDTTGDDSRDYVGVGELKLDADALRREFNTRVLVGGGGITAVLDFSEEDVVQVVGREAEQWILQLGVDALTRSIERDRWLSLLEQAPGLDLILKGRATQDHILGLLEESNAAELERLARSLKRAAGVRRGPKTRDWGTLTTLVLEAEQELKFVSEERRRRRNKSTAWQAVVKTPIGERIKRAGLQRRWFAAGRSEDVPRLTARQMALELVAAEAVPPVSWKTLGRKVKTRNSAGRSPY